MLGKAIVHFILITMLRETRKSHLISKGPKCLFHNLVNPQTPRECQLRHKAGEDKDDAIIVFDTLLSSRSLPLTSVSDLAEDRSHHHPHLCGSYIFRILGSNVSVCWSFQFNQCFLLPLRCQERGAG